MSVALVTGAARPRGIGRATAVELARRGNDIACLDIARPYAEAPGHVLTSMVKGVDAAVFDVIRRAKDGSFRGGIFQFGLAEGGVGYVYDANNKALIPDSIRTRLQALQAEIVAGKISVPSTR